MIYMNQWAQSFSEAVVGEFRTEMKKRKPLARQHHHGPRVERLRSFAHFPRGDRSPNTSASE